MDIKLKAVDIEIPSAPYTSPFENDKLNRKEFAEILSVCPKTNLLYN